MLELYNEGCVEGSKNHIKDKSVDLIICGFEPRHTLYEKCIPEFKSRDCRT